MEITRHTGRVTYTLVLSEPELMALGTSLQHSLMYEPKGISENIKLFTLQLIKDIGNVRVG